MAVRKQVFAVIRLDRIGSCDFPAEGSPDSSCPGPENVQVVRVCYSMEHAILEVDRLNHLNGGKGLTYYWQTTSLEPLIGHLSLHVQQVISPNDKPAIWRIKILTSAGYCVFDSAWLSITLSSRSAAEWMGNIVLLALDRSCGEPVPGHVTPRSPASVGLNVEWVGDIDDDCRGTFHGVDAHLEHLSGPMKKGGIWFCELTTANISLVATHSIPGLTIRSSAAGRWLCVQLARAHAEGIPIAFPH